MNQFKDLNCILLVDDDNPTNYIHQIVIKKSLGDVFVQPITNAEDALDYLTCRGKFVAANPCPQPGIIFLDINMPGMDGWEFMDEYATLTPNQKAKVVVIMLTNSLNPDDRMRAERNKDISTFLTKPLSPQAVSELAMKYFSA